MTTYIDGALFKANVYCISADHLVMSCNMQQVHELQKKHPGEVSGKYLYELLSSKQAAVYINNHEKVMRSKRAIFFTETIISNQGNLITHIAHKYPMLDRKQKVIGIMGESILVRPEHKELSEILLMLSEQERFCFHLLLKGLSIKAIALFMHLSPRTIEHYAANVRSKLSCKNNKELIANYFLIKQ